jgi:1,2-diacylglycerol 3-alpha-glucosyltransferase
LRIAIFTDTFLPQVNGVVRTITTLAQGLVSRGHEVAIFTIDVNKIKTQEISSASGLNGQVQIYTFFSATSPWFKDIQLRFPTIVAPFSAARQFRPDIIHSQTSFGIGWDAVMVAKLLKCPLIGTHHGFLAEYLNNIKLDFDLPKRLMRHYLAFYFNRCDAVTTPCRALSQELLDHRLQRPLQVISNPLDLHHFSVNMTKAALRNKYRFTKPTLVHVGRLVAQKSIEVLINAFARLVKRGLDANLVIIGEGRERPQLEALIRELAIIDSVIFTGLLMGNDLIERVAASDVFVSASTTEAQALAFLEAMALGLPAIGVRAGGVPEYVHHEKNGLVVAPHDPEALTQAMRRLIEDAALRESYGACARARVKAYEAQAVLDKLEALYQGLKDQRVH